MDLSQEAEANRAGASAAAGTGMVLLTLASVCRAGFTSRPTEAPSIAPLPVAAPLLLSRDIYTYAAYGRIEALYHRNPYVATLSTFPHDPFVAVTSAQWHHTHTLYGPAFTLASAAIVRWASVGATIFAFKMYWNRPSNGEVVYSEAGVEPALPA